MNDISPNPAPPSPVRPPLTLLARLLTHRRWREARNAGAEELALYSELEQAVTAAQPAQTTFQAGFACALASLIRSHGINTGIAEQIRWNLGTLEDCRAAGVDEDDLEVLAEHLNPSAPNQA